MRLMVSKYAKNKTVNCKVSPLATLKYIHNTAHEQEYGAYNMYRDRDDIHGMTKEILNNESERGTRKYYHEIVAFHPSEPSERNRKLDYEGIKSELEEMKRRFNEEVPRILQHSEPSERKKQSEL